MACHYNTRNETKTYLNKIRYTLHTALSTMHIDSGSKPNIIDVQLLVTVTHSGYYMISVRMTWMEYINNSKSYKLICFAAFLHLCVLPVFFSQFIPVTYYQLIKYSCLLQLLIYPVALSSVQYTA